MTERTYPVDAYEKPLPLPYFQTRRGERISMPLSEKITITESVRAQHVLYNIYTMFDLFWNLYEKGKMIDGLPGMNGRNNSLFERAQVEGLTGLPASPFARIDVVNGKIVDINMKPSGLGLTLRAENIWASRGMEFSAGNVSETIPDRFDSAIILTEKGYPFVSDQEVFAEELQIRTGKKSRLIYCDLETPGGIKKSEAIYCFSWLSGENMRIWRDYLFENGSQFILDPLSSIWDNKALMALPTLEIDLDSGPVRKDLIKLKKAFPKTYLLRKNDTDLEMATAISEDSIAYQKLNKFNVFAMLGDVYLKPLNDSGSRGVVKRSLQDWGTAIDSLLRYGDRYPSFVVQQAVVPEQVWGLSVKDGYFVSSGQGNTKICTIERMVSRSKDIIHGGSQTALAPILIK